MYKEAIRMLIEEQAKSLQISEKDVENNLNKYPELKQKIDKIPYNSADREIKKMCMNGILGKLSELLHLDTIKYVKHSEYKKMIEKQ